MTSDEWVRRRDRVRARMLRVFRINKEGTMFPRLSGRFLGTCAVIGALLLLLAPAAANAQVVVKVNDTVNFRFGLQIQSWADWTQDPNSEGYPRTSSSAASGRKCSPLSRPT